MMKLEEEKRLYQIIGKAKKGETITEEDKEWIKELRKKFIIPGSFKTFMAQAELRYEIEEIKEFKQVQNKREQGSVRQIALAFHFMVLADHLPRGVNDPSKNAKFLKFITGLSHDNLRKHLGSMEKGEVKGIESERQMREILKDLDTLRPIFKDILFEKEVELIDIYINKLNNSIIDMKE